MVATGVARVSLETISLDCLFILDYLSGVANPSPSRPRRTQAERSAYTRQRLLDAALVCLAERGYTGTTTTEVAERAGVSRGAQLHHFPTRSELVVAACEHLVERRLEEFRKAVLAFPAGADVVDGAVEVLWSMFSDPSAYAMLELAVAARTDPELREHLRPLAARFEDSLGRAARELLPDPVVGDARFLTVRNLTVSLLQGMAVDAIVNPAPEQRAALLAFLKDVGRQFLASAGAAGAVKEARA